MLFLLGQWKCLLFSFLYPVMNIMIFTKICQYILGLNRLLMLCTCAVIIFMVYIMMCLNEGNDFNNNVSPLFQVSEYCDASVLVLHLWSWLFTYCCAVINEVLLIIMFHFCLRFLNNFNFLCRFELESLLFTHVLL
jgi:hypothetical protein